MFPYQETAYITVTTATEFTTNKKNFAVMIKFLLLVKQGQSSPGDSN